MISGRSVRCWLAVAGLVLFAAGGCTNNAPSNNIESAPERWGPLAVVDDPAAEGLDARGGAGPLHIGEDCVTLRLEEADRGITLVWRSGQVQWDESTREIVFENPGEGKVRLSDGETIEVGGEDMTDPSPEWLANTLSF